MKSRTNEEAADYSKRTTNFGEIFKFKFKSAAYKLYDLGRVTVFAGV